MAMEDAWPCQGLKKRAWRHGRAWKMKIRALKNHDPRALNLQANLHSYIGIKYDKCVNNGQLYIVKVCTVEFFVCTSWA